MALVVETGLNVSGATSYASLTFIRAYAAARGIAFPSDDAVAEQNILLAMDQLEAIEFDSPTFLGSRTNDTQALAWPRKDVVLKNGATIARTTIPLALQNALAQLAADSSNTEGGLVSNTTGQAVTEETVGPITVKYATPQQGGTAGEQSRFHKFEQLLAPLLNLNNGTGCGFSTRRI